MDKKTQNRLLFVGYYGSIVWVSLRVVYLGLKMFGLVSMPGTSSSSLFMVIVVILIGSFILIFCPQEQSRAWRVLIGSALLEGGVDLILGGGSNWRVSTRVLALIGGIYAFLGFRRLRFEKRSG